MKHIVCIVCLVCFFCVSLAAEEPVEPAKTPELTELEQLTLKNLLQGFTIAQLQRQAAQRNQDAAHSAFWAQVGRLFEKKGISKDEYDFNPKTMSFVAKPPAAAGKPESPKDTEKRQEE